MRDEKRGTKRLRDQLDWERQQKEKAHSLVKNLERVCVKQDRLQVDVDAYIASIAIRREERQKQRSRIKGVLQDTQDPRNTVRYNTGNILNSTIPVLYQSTVTCMHKFRLYYSTTYNTIPKVSSHPGVGL